MLKLILAFILALTLTTVHAQDYDEVDMRAKNFNPSEQPILIKRKFIKKGTPDTLVMTENFGILYMESNLKMDEVIQDMPPSTDRSEFMTFSYELAADLLKDIYGIRDTDFHVGLIRVGSITMAPEGYIVMVDVTFTRDGEIYKARLGRLNADPNDETGSVAMSFIYPLTR